MAAFEIGFITYENYIFIFICILPINPIINPFIHVRSFFKEKLELGKIFEKYSAFFHSLK